MKQLLLLLTMIILSSCTLPKQVEPQQVRVVEILGMDYRDTTFKGSDGEIYSVNQDTYKKGDFMSCYRYERTDKRLNWCNRLRDNK